MFEALVSQTQLSIFIQITPVLPGAGVQQDTEERRRKRRGRGGNKAEEDCEEHCREQKTLKC